MKISALSFNVALFFSAFVGLTSRAASPNFNFACLNSPETAYYQVIDFEDHVTVRAAHLYGPDSMPIFDGLVSTTDLARIGKFAPLLSSIGPTLTVNFPRSNCQRKGAYLFQCQDFKNAPVQMINGHSVRALSFYSTHIAFDTVDLSYVMLQLNLYLEVDGESYFLPMRYSPHDCSTPG